MSSESTHPVTELLQAIRSGDNGASEELLHLLYGELKQLANEQVRRTPQQQTLQATALVNEVYLRLFQRDSDSGWENRKHFFFAASRAMHDLLVEEARRKTARKRGGGRRRVDLEDMEIALDSPPNDVLALDDALRKLEAEDPRKAELVRLRFFAGLDQRETAAALGISMRTASRDWRYTRAWLYSELSGENSGEESGEESR